MRFMGTVQTLDDVHEVGVLVEWITSVDFEDWPQQTRLQDGGIRPAMVKDLEWHGFGDKVAWNIDSLVGDHFVGGDIANRMLTVVMPGHSIPPHIDEQPPNWVCRVHVPLTTNAESRFVVGGEHHHMEVGKAYLVNTEVEHSVTNDGDSPRIHLMFDVLG